MCIVCLVCVMAECIYARVSLCLLIIFFHPFALFSRSLSLAHSLAFSLPRSLFLYLWYLCSICSVSVVLAFSVSTLIRPWLNSFYQLAMAIRVQFHPSSRTSAFFFLSFFFLYTHTSHADDLHSPLASWHSNNNMYLYVYNSNAYSLGPKRYWQINPRPDI